MRLSALAFRADTLKAGSVPTVPQLVSPQAKAPMRIRIEGRKALPLGCSYFDFTVSSFVMLKKQHKRKSSTKNFPN